MNLERHIPDADLQPFIREFLFISSDAEAENIILPDASMALAIRYAGHVSIAGSQLPPAVLSGLRKSSRKVLYTPGSGKLLIRFKPGGAAAFFREPLHEFFQETIPAADLEGFSDIADIADQLSELPDNTQRLQFIQKVLRQRRQRQTPDALIATAVNHIVTAKGALSIGHLSKQLYISQDAFEKRFRGSVGTTAKQFSSIIRLRHVIDSYSPARSLTDLAYSAGYFDQAHFTRDFSVFTGLAPRRFFSTARFW